MVCAPYCAFDAALSTLEALHSSPLIISRLFSLLVDCYPKISVLLFLQDVVPHFLQGVGQFA